MIRHLALFVAVAALATACKAPLHLSYDFGRAYVETLRVQADLTRPSVQYAGYSLYGPEAAMIRLNVLTSTTESEDAKGTFEADASTGN